MRNPPDASVAPAKSWALSQGRNEMTRIVFKAFAVAALLGLTALSLPSTAEAGRGWAARVMWVPG